MLENTFYRYRYYEEAKKINFDKTKCNHLISIL